MNLTSATQTNAVRNAAFRYLAPTGENCFFSKHSASDRWCFYPALFD